MWSQKRSNLANQNEHWHATGQPCFALYQAICWHQRNLSQTYRRNTVSKVGMSHGYHQISLAEESQAVSTFQTHEGLHRFKVVFFGVSSATDLFHDRVKAALNGLPGCTSIYDNILVWESTSEEHEESLDKCLTRLQDKGLTLCHKDAPSGATCVSWFGTVFSKSGMSADPRKIKAIQEAGPLRNNDYVKVSFKPANSMQDSCLTQQVPMQSLLNHYATWWKRMQDLSCPCSVNSAYHDNVTTMTIDTALRSYNPELKTIHITDVGPEGIALSVFQKQDNGCWVPADQASRALTPCEKSYSQTEKESIVQSWRMTMHWYYLQGIPFDSYTDHQPLIPIYGNIVSRSGKTLP